jgi:anti-sigma factor RsiW
MTHQHISEEDASLYALGSLEPHLVQAFDREAFECDECAHRLADAAAALERIALEDLRLGHAPRRLRLGLRRARPDRMIAICALAAALIVAVLAGWRMASLERSVAQNDVAFATIVHSHFAHAQFTPTTPAAPSAKVLYALDGSWLYVIAVRPAQTVTVEAIRPGSPPQVLGTLPATNGTSTLFARLNRRFSAAILVDRNGNALARAALIYRRTP